MGTPIELIAGLGNPGADYARTRHNAGFWFVDLLADQHGGHFSADNKLHGVSAEIRLAGHRIRLLKPMTYMNLSGQAVSAAVSYYKIETDRVLVAYDELDLPRGRAQLKFGGGSAGHNGVASVIEHIGTEFWRLRFGVGHPRDQEREGAREVIDHLLGRASSGDEQAIKESLERAADVLPVMLEQGAERAKNRLHTRTAAE